MGKLTAQQGLFSDTPPDLAKAARGVQRWMDQQDERLDRNGVSDIQQEAHWLMSQLGKIGMLDGDYRSDLKLESGKGVGKAEFARRIIHNRFMYRGIVELLADEQASDAEDAKQKWEAAQLQNVRSAVHDAEIAAATDVNDNDEDALMVRAGGLVAAGQDALIEDRLHGPSHISGPLAVVLAKVWMKALVNGDPQAKIGCLIDLWKSKMFTCDLVTGYLESLSGAPAFARDKVQRAVQWVEATWTKLDDAALQQQKPPTLPGSTQKLIGSEI